jgi:hypothetical protein
MAIQTPEITLAIMRLSIGTKAAALRLNSLNLSDIYRQIGLDLADKYVKGRTHLLYVDGHPFHCAMMTRDELDQFRSDIHPSTFNQNIFRLIWAGFLLRLHSTQPLFDEPLFLSMPEFDAFYLSEEPSNYLEHLAYDAEHPNAQGEKANTGPKKNREPQKVYCDLSGQPNKYIKLSGFLKKRER